MKKLIIALLLVLAFALPAGAAQQLGVFVNGVQLNQEAIMQDGSVYVPLRAVAETLGCEVTWDGQHARVESAKEPEAPEAPEMPEIVGDKKFKKTINEAMSLLYKKDAAHYALIVQNVEVIGVNDREETNENNAKTTAVARGNAVMFMPEFIKDRLFVPEFIAGVLAHEASHVANNNVSGDASWSWFDTRTKEIMAFEHEIVALRLVGAPEWIIKDRERLITQYKN